MALSRQARDRIFTFIAAGLGQAAVSLFFMHLMYEAKLEERPLSQQEFRQLVGQEVHAAVKYEIEVGLNNEWNRQHPDQRRLNHGEGL